MGVAAGSWVKACVSGQRDLEMPQGPPCPLVYACPPPTPTGDGWLLKAVSLGPWVHLIEELQVFDQEPVESLVLSQSKVVIKAPPTAVPIPSPVFCLARTGVGRHSNTPHLAWGAFQETRVLTDSALGRRYI